VAHSSGAGPQGSGSGWGPRQGREGTAAERGGEAGWMGDADSPRHEGDRLQPLHGGWERREQIGGIAGPGTTGFWSRADWIPCRDGKARPVEPCTFPLAHGVSNRVGRLRAYGNAIVPALAAEILAAFMEVRQ
jgi:DNA (cytosine-5)-methyltransferase 1